MLITCPHCGKTVSDKAKQCVHCNTLLNENKSPAPENTQIDYLSLNNEEQKALLDEFFNENPTHKKTIKLLNVFRIATIISAILFVCIFVATIIYIATSMKYLNTPEPPQRILTTLFILLGFAGFLVVAIIVFDCIHSAYDKKTLKIIEAQSEWMKNKNIINYDLPFNYDDFDM